MQVFLHLFTYEGGELVNDSRIHPCTYVIWRVNISTWALSGPERTFMIVVKIGNDFVKIGNKLCRVRAIQTQIRQPNLTITYIEHLWGKLQVPSGLAAWFQHPWNLQNGRNPDTWEVFDQIFNQYLIQSTEQTSINTFYFNLVPAHIFSWKLLQ